MQNGKRVMLRIEAAKARIEALVGTGFIGRLINSGSLWTERRTNKRLSDEWLRMSRQMSMDDTKRVKMFSDSLIVARTLSEAADELSLFQAVPKYAYSTAISAEDWIFLESTLKKTDPDIVNTIMDFINIVPGEE